MCECKHVAPLAICVRCAFTFHRNIIIKESEKLISVIFFSSFVYFAVVIPSFYNWNYLLIDDSFMFFCFCCSVRFRWVRARAHYYFWWPLNGRCLATSLRTRRRRRRQWRSAHRINTSLGIYKSTSRMHTYYRAWCDRQTHRKRENSWLAPIKNEKKKNEEGRKSHRFGLWRASMSTHRRVSIGHLLWCSCVFFIIYRFVGLCMHRCRAQIRLIAFVRMLPVRSTDRSRWNNTHTLMCYISNGDGTHAVQ